jgi:dihydrofolate reductase
VRQIIAAMQMSLDGYISGPNGEIDWIDNWEDSFDLLPQIDTCILGRGMFGGYEAYWRQIFASPNTVSPFTGLVPSTGEVTYARFADQATHVVLSRSMSETSWHNTRFARSVDDIRALKTEPGKDIHAVGGATLVSTLLNARLVDEIRVVVRPLVLAGGKAMFKDVVARQSLQLTESRPLGNGQIRLTYRVA